MESPTELAAEVLGSLPSFQRALDVLGFLPPLILDTEAGWWEHSRGVLKPPLGRLIGDLISGSGVLENVEVRLIIGAVHIFLGRSLKGSFYRIITKQNTTKQ